MQEGEAARVQGDDTVARQFRRRAEGLGRVIENIAPHWPAARRQLHADLVRPSGVRLDLEQSSLVEPLQDAVVQPGRFGSWSLGGNDLGARLLRDLEQPV